MKCHFNLYFQYVSRFFFAKRRLMSIALGRSSENEVKKNLHKISSLLQGEYGLFLTNKPKEEVVQWVLKLLSIVILKRLISEVIFIYPSIVNLNLQFLNVMNIMVSKKWISGANSITCGLSPLCYLWNVQTSRQFYSHTFYKFTPRN